MENKTKKKTGLIVLFRGMILLLALSIITLLMLSSCGSASSNGDYAPEAPNMAPDIEEGFNGKDDYIDGDYTYNGISGDVITTDRKIIKTVRQTVQTTEYQAFIDALRGKISELGGYISDATYNDNAYSGGQCNATITVRIPAESLDLFTGATRELGTVIRHHETSNDITVEYVDIDSRIKVLESEEQSLLSMLEKADTINDMLTVKGRLTDVQANLASLRAQKKSYDGLVAYSTVYMTINEVKEIEPPAEQSFGDELGGRFLGSISAIGDFFRGLGLWLLGDSPVILLLLAIGVGIFFLVRYLIKRIGRRRSDEGAEDK